MTRRRFLSLIGLGPLTVMIGRAVEPIPCFDVGKDYVTCSGCCMTGFSETVVPASLSNVVTINVSALDGANVLAFIQRNGRLIANALQPCLNQP